jgi:tetratricopeptide (TPR) repeat protein
VAPLLVLLAWADLALGLRKDALRELSEALTRAREHNLRPTLARALAIQALASIQQAEYVPAVEALEEALALARAMPYPYAEAKALYVYGQLHTARGEAELAHDTLQQALAICDRLGEGLYRAHIERTLAAIGAPVPGDERAGASGASGAADGRSRRPRGPRRRARRVRPR